MAAAAGNSAPVKSCRIAHPTRSGTALGLVDMNRLEYRRTRKKEEPSATHKEKTHTQVHSQSRSRRRPMRRTGMASNATIKQTWSQTTQASPRRMPAAAHGTGFGWPWPAQSPRAGRLGPLPAFGHAKEGLPEAGQRASGEEGASDPSDVQERSNPLSDERGVKESGGKESQAGEPQGQAPP